MAAIDALAGQRQILRGSAGTLSAIWYADGVTTDPGSVTVGIVNSAGTVVLAPTAASPGTGSGQRVVGYTTANTATLDTWTVTWTSATYGAFTATVEVVGAWLFTIAEAQAFDNNAVLSARPVIDVPAIEEARARVTYGFELLTGVSWVPRYRTDIYNGDGTSEMFLKTGRVRSMRLTEERLIGQSTWRTFDANEMADLQCETMGMLHRETGGTFLYGSRNYRIGYEHGYDGPTLEIKRAALLAARYELIPSGVTDRAISISNEMGSTQLWTPGVSARGRAIHPLPDVDRILQDHIERVPVVA